MPWPVVESGVIAFSDGGDAARMRYWLMPVYEPPCRATWPSHQSCAAIHSTAS